MSLTTGQAGSWNPNANNSVYALATSPSSVHAGGTFDFIGGTSQKFLAGMDAVPMPVGVPPGVERGSAGLSLALDSNPTQREFRVAFSLPAAAPARLELFDVSGRRIAAREVGALGMGAHLVVLGEGRALEPGAYVVRLSQGDRVRTARGVILQ